MILISTRNDEFTNIRCHSGRKHQRADRRQKAAAHGNVLRPNISRQQNNLRRYYVQRAL
jgi:hypothetical protein